MFRIVFFIIFLSSIKFIFAISPATEVDRPLHILYEMAKTEGVLLGKGKHGEVYKIGNAAIKRVKKESVRNMAHLEEIMIYEHPCIYKISKFEEYKGAIYYQSDFYPTTLSRYLKEMPGNVVDKDLEKRKIFLKILLTIYFLRQEGFCRMDLDYLNIMMDLNGSPVIIDLDSVVKNDRYGENKSLDLNANNFIHDFFKRYIHNDKDRKYESAIRWNGIKRPTNDLIDFFYHLPSFDEARKDPEIGELIKLLDDKQIFLTSA